MTSGLQSQQPTDESGNQLIRFHFVVRPPTAPVCCLTFKNCSSVLGKEKLERVFFFFRKSFIFRASCGRWMAGGHEEGAQRKENQTVPCAGIYTRLLPLAL